MHFIVLNRPLKYSLIISLVIVALLSLPSCRDEESEMPTIAPVATVPALPTVRLVPPSPTPDSIEGRFHDPIFSTTRPELEVIVSSEDFVSAQHPGLIDVEIVSMTPFTLSLEISREEDDGRRRLIDRQQVNLQSNAQVAIAQSPAGIHEHLEIWYPIGYYLSDGAAGDFIYLVRDEDGPGIVAGLYRQSGAEASVEANLLFDLEEMTLIALQAASSGRELDPEPGDSFQTQHYTLEEDQSSETEAGTILLFDEGSILSLETRPLPDGFYKLRFRSDPQITTPNLSGSLFTVNNSSLVIGQRVYFDPDHGLQFHVPEKWPDPEYEDGILLTNDHDSSVRLTVTSQPDMRGFSSSEFRSHVLETFGNVQLLYEEPVTIGEISTSWTAYGYESDTGFQTGVFLAFTRGEWGYLFDIEGHSTDQEDVLRFAEVLFDSLHFRREYLEDRTGRWSDVSDDSFNVSAATAFLYVNDASGWHKFAAKDGESFIAVRTVATGDPNPEESLSNWLRIVEERGSSFTRSKIYELELGTEKWLRRDFTYIDPDGEVKWGFITSIVGIDHDTVVWAESSADGYELMHRDIFLPMMVDLKVNSQGE
jgi:hypothetical protein